MVDKDLAISLDLPEDCNDDEVTSTITSLLVSSVHDATSPKTLSEIYHIITTFGVSSYLDTLNLIPLLLLCDDQAARNVISLIGECGSAKEVVMTVQEAVENLERTLEREDEEDHDAEETKDEDEAAEQTSTIIKQNSTISQFLILVDLYSSAIPRIKLRRKSASETLRPLLEELENVMGLAMSRATRNEACETISIVSKLAVSVQKWIYSNVPVDTKDNVEVGMEACKAIVQRLLDRALLICGHGLHTSIAQRTLEKCYPRLAFRSDEYTGEAEIMEWLDAYRLLDVRFEDLNRQASTSDLIFYAYTPPDQIDVQKLLSFLFPVLISSIQTNQFLNESLAVLTSNLHTWQSTQQTTSLPHEITLPLCGLVPSLASAHPEPSTRHQAFRVLALLLSAADPRLRFQHLIEYTQDSQYPQMRVAAVGLVKDALLESLSNQQRKDDPLSTQLFLRRFGPILFRPDPQDLFSEALTLKEFQETPEPGRLVECLSLYYVLLQRDTGNVTGIRDKDVQNSVEHNLLSPLRASVDRWMANSETSRDHLHAITPIVSLKICLERVDTALASLLA